MINPAFVTIGKETDNIPVQISYRIIELFSEGLYSSPNKAIEELVSNSFDAGANKVHVIISPDRATHDATITVIDDGESMDIAGLKQHWIIGNSNKRNVAHRPKGRMQIGKFGIGKLATYVLAHRLTHICKKDSHYYATTMDYRQIPEGDKNGIGASETVTLPVRELSEQEAIEALSFITSGIKPGYKSLVLFGQGAEKTWTVAIMSDLKEMAKDIKMGRLSWVLKTAMPLRDDFKLFLNGDAQPPAKSLEKPVKKWILGKDIKDLPKPAPDDLEPTEETNDKTYKRYGLTHPSLGRITGYVEVYDNLLTTGKAAEIGRSNGFFVYVHGRLINLDDELFGLAALRHGTFARFRMVVNIDRLDEELRSTRETVREGSLLYIARNILHATFNQARGWLLKHEEAKAPGALATDRIAQSPGSLTRNPLVGLLKLAISGDIKPHYISFPTNLTPEQQQTFLANIEEKAATPQGLVTRVELADLEQDQGVAVLNIDEGVLQINTLHPFVAAHRDDYERVRDTMSLLVMVEVLTEAHLYALGVDEKIVNEVMARRDEMLRQFSRSMKRTANTVAQALMDAVTDKNQLEIELVAAFDSLGFEAIRLGGSGKPDGIAYAHLAAADGKERRYSVSLEAKSKEELGSPVSAKTVGVSTVALHRKEHKCDHAIVVGPDFPTKGGDTSLIKQLREDRLNTNKTITLVRVNDLARLVRRAPLKRIGLDRIRGLFENCSSPEESSEWIKALLNEQPEKPPFKEILDIIWELQQEEPLEAIEFASVATSLRYKKNIIIQRGELRDLCVALSQISPEVVIRETSIELTQRPDKIIEAAGTVLTQFPEEEQQDTIFKFQ